MSKIQKIALMLTSAGTALLGLASGAGATILTLPSYSDVINTTTTAFGGSLLTDILPIAGFLAVITIVGLVLSAVVKRALGAISKIAGGRRRGGRGRRRR